MKRFFYVPLFAGIFFTISFVRANDNPAFSKLNGTWVLVSSQNGDMPEQVVPDSFPVLYQKQFNETHFCAVTYSKDGRVLRVNGGTYTLESNVYTENITYSTIQSMPNIQSTFTLEMKGDEMHISGLVSDGKLKLKEVWKKADTNRAVLTKSNMSMSKIDENGVFFAPDQFPQFPGGQKAFSEYLSANLHYPDTKEKIQGVTVIRFIVSETGKIDNLEVMRSLHPDFDKEAIRVIRSMPDWIPGKHEGKAIPVYFSLPVRFVK